MKALTSIILLFVATQTFSQSFIAKNGRLQVKGHQLCNEQGKAIQLKGFSTHNTTFCPECVTYDALLSNRDFWGVNVVRAAIYTDDWWNANSYNKNPQMNKNMIDSIVRWTEKLGLYCIIDWHILTRGNPDAKIHSGADGFFQEMTSKYGNKPHVFYEICNEPNGNGVTWDTIANYANRIIPIIRKNAPKAVILIGTPQWCQYIDKVEPAKLKDTSNVMYTFHFYAATHLGLLPMFLKEIHRIPIFVSEWGVCESSGNGNINFDNSDKYLDAMAKHIEDTDTVSISWCNFSYGDKKEAASVLQPQSCSNKLWGNMSPAGLYIRERLKKK